MNKMHHFKVAAIMVAVMFVACDSDDPVDDGGGSHSTNSGMVMTLSVQGTPQYMKPVNVSFTFRVDPDALWETPDTVIAKSYVRGLPTFEVVSGDTAWTDTLAAADSRTHTFVMRPRYHGMRIQCASVSTLLDSTRALSGGFCKEITVP